VVVGMDIGKFELRAMCRWANGDWERPWRVHNPSQLGELVAVLEELRQGRKFVVAMEPSGTYGDALRQALQDVEIEVYRVSPKAAHDYAEVFDGVPSQHDGKDAAVVAELAAYGKAQVWRNEAASDWQQELSYWVDWLEGHRRTLQMWVSRLEALLARHWPEATRILKLSSATLLRALCISKRGQARARQWLYFAALRLVRKAGVQRWYQVKKAKDGQKAKGALVAIMRRLALGLYQVAVHGEVFDARRLFPGEALQRAAATAKTASSRRG